MKNKRFALWGIVIMTMIALVVDWPKVPVKINLGSLHIDTVIAGPDIDVDFLGMKIRKELNIKEGLDLQGGTRLVLQADMKDIASEDRDKALESARDVIDRRVNLYGVSEPLVQTSKSGNDYRIIAELPGVKDINQAKDLVGKTALLEFREFKEVTPSAQEVPTLDNTKETGLTGKDLKSANADFNSQNAEPVVSFKMTPEGGSKFADITKRLVGKPLVIFLDDQAVTWPTVREPITGGEGVISGNFTVDQAKELSIQLNAGALPVPVKIAEERTVGATLGQESVNKSLFAGVIGLAIVIVFMIVYYHLPGILAAGALIIYSLLALALFKLIPVTLTLAGIAGFILSIGMAVDANILIFERMREELRAGKQKKIAMEIGFARAWSSIRDSNVSSLITCGILYGFGTGIVRNFALTLAVGILVSMFSAIVVTKNFLRLIYKK
ncbi:MAG: protein translocase subunit SecD [Patescibacteria group bacterium]|nr:protein translocase subunit SecD [Patescibacteria group bacterium]